MSSLHASYFGELRINGEKLGRRDDLLAKAIYRNLPPLRGGKGTKWPSGDDLKSFKDLNEDVYNDLIQKDIEKDGKKVPFNQRFKKVLDQMVKDSFIMEREGAYAKSKERRLESDGKEAHYYPAIQDELERFWALEDGREYHHRHRFLAVLDTHHEGGVATGEWARPDITVVGGKVLPYLPSKFVDVHTFEVKIGLPLIGIYEALAHRRSSHYASVLYIWHEGGERPDASQISSVVREATKQGIGVMLLEQYDDYSQWRELTEPVRYEPDPQVLNDFLRRQSDRDDFGLKLQTWIHQPDNHKPPVREKDAELLMFTTEQLIVAKEIIKRLENSDEEYLSSKDFPEYQDSGDVFNKVRTALSDAELIQFKSGKVSKANGKLFELDRTDFEEVTTENSDSAT